LRDLISSAGLRGVLRRALSVACAIAFVLVTLVHSVRHVAAHAPAGDAQFELSLVDGDAGALDHGQAGVDHCHGCLMVGIAAAEPPAATVDTRAVETGVKLPSVCAHPPTNETPPPIV
jgi:hypothetical protein